MGQAPPDPSGLRVVRRVDDRVRPRPRADRRVHRRLLARVSPTSARPHRCSPCCRAACTTTTRAGDEPVVHGVRRHRDDRPADLRARGRCRSAPAGCCSVGAVWAVFLWWWCDIVGDRRVNRHIKRAASLSRPATRLPLTSTASSPASEPSASDRVGRRARCRRGRCRPRSARCLAPPRSAAMARCSAAASLISAITPSDGDAAIAAQIDQRVDCGAHRRRVGVVGIVEDDRARRVPVRPACASP